MDFFGGQRVRKKAKLFSARHTSTAGFSALELLIVVIIISIVLSIFSGSFFKYARVQQFNEDVQNVREQMRSTQQQTIASVGDTTYGFNVAEDTVTLFTGVTYAPADPANIPIDLRYATASASFSNGLDYLSFDRIYGAPSATGTVVFHNTQINETATITIYASGLIE